MRVVHVLRKPLSEGTVAANTLRHGCGGLNIDASRIACRTGEVLTTHTQGAGAATADDKVYGKYEGGFTTHQTKGQKQGRWPGNLILQHLPGCRRGCVPRCPVGVLDEQSGTSRFYKQVGG